jgi:hypothetical protein
MKGLAKEVVSMRKYAVALLFTTLVCAPALKAGGIFVSNDEWMFGDCCLSSDNDAAFSQNIAHWLTGGSGNILIDSSNFGLAGSGLKSELTGLGYGVTEAPGTTNFSGYNAVFVGGPAVDNTALINYVKGGGSVFLEAGTADPSYDPVAEAAEWNTFLNVFGLQLAPVYNGVSGDIDVSAFQTQGGYSNALFNGVNTVYIDNGNDVGLGLTGAGPADQIWTTINGDGLYGAWATPEPVSMLLFGTFLSLAGGFLGRKKRA